MNSPNVGDILMGLLLFGLALKLEKWMPTWAAYSIAIVTAMALGWLGLATPMFKT